MAAAARARAAAARAARKTAQAQAAARAAAESAAFDALVAGEMTIGQVVLLDGLDPAAAAQLVNRAARARGDQVRALVEAQRARDVQAAAWRRGSRVPPEPFVPLTVAGSAQSVPPGVGSASHARGTRSAPC